MTPLAYILAPFALAIGLFLLYLLVSALKGDPGRPFRMFSSPPLPRGPEDEEEDPNPRDKRSP